MTLSEGRASVWICATEGGRGCGFIGFYKPEIDDNHIVNNLGRRCPGCGATWPYHKTGDIARIVVEAGE